MKILLIILMMGIGQQISVGVTYYQFQDSYEITRSQTQNYLTPTATEDGIWTDDKDKLVFTPHEQSFYGTTYFIFDGLGYDIHIMAY